MLLYLVTSSRSYAQTCPEMYAEGSVAFSIMQRERGGAQRTTCYMTPYIWHSVGTEGPQVVAGVKGREEITEGLPGPWT